MKQYISVGLTVIIAVGMTACGASSSKPEASPTASQTVSFTEVPEVSGATYSKAKIALIAQGLQPKFLSENGSLWGDIAAGEYALAIATEPKVGTRVAKGTTVKVTMDATVAEAAEKLRVADAAAAEAEALATRYTFSCTTASYTDSESFTYHSYSDVWSSPSYDKLEKCNVRIEGRSTLDPVELREDEQRIAAIIGDQGGDASIPSHAFANALQLCAKPPFDYPNNSSRSSRSTQALATAALALCPEAPHASLLQEAATTSSVKDGTFVVGEEMQPGTYQTRANLEDCYWSRTTGGGSIIANDFIGFAPAGATVSVYAGEGFESSSCGVWTKVG